MASLVSQSFATLTMAMWEFAACVVRGSGVVKSFRLSIGALAVCRDTAQVEWQGVVS
jgi:hypothetical protein